MKSTRTFTWFRKVAAAEGISFLVLLFIAMPLKYFADIPEAVSTVGSAHGFLFVSFMVLVLVVKSEFDKSFIWVIKALVASIIPFGTFVMEKYWKQEEAAVNNRL